MYGKCRDMPALNNSDIINSVSVPYTYEKAHQSTTLYKVNRFLWNKIKIVYWKESGKNSMLKTLHVRLKF